MRALLIWSKYFFGDVCYENEIAFMEYHFYHFHHKTSGTQSETIGSFNIISLNNLIFLTLTSLKTYQR